MYGITHRAENPNGAVVIMFNIGLHYRVCHSRLFVRQARDLQRAGFHVVRFDPSRVGFSHGEIVVERAIDCYNSVQTGLFKEDALQLINYVRSELNPQKIYLYGLCGGALTAIIAAALDTNVDGVLFVAGPVTVTSAEFELSTLHPLDAKVDFLGYRARLLRPQAWLRFLSGRTSYRKLFRSMAVLIKDKFRSKAGPSDDSGSQPNGEEQKGDLYNRTYGEAFHNLMTAHKKVLFLMPELDRATYDFDRIFAARFLHKYDDHKDDYSIERVAKANHTFSTPESTRQLFDITRKWLLNEVSSKVTG